jgi:DNA adenine methylase
MNKKKSTKPLLKWAGGKTQLLSKIVPKMPKQYGKFIEPFIGGGALFFHVQPTSSVIADINPELINLYKTVAHEADKLIEALHCLQNNEDEFYRLRALDWIKLTNVEAAARTIFLNKTCFNGLYRVNKKGKFNVPYNKNKNAKIIDELTIIEDSKLLKNSKIICGDYRNVLKENATTGDFIFLDPPYLPIASKANFTNYTKESFSIDDHINLGNEISRLNEIGCHVILTNSNHPMVYEQYKNSEIDLVKTHRNISSNSLTRNGEDLIITFNNIDRVKNES